MGELVQGEMDQSDWFPEQCRILLYRPLRWTARELNSLIRVLEKSYGLPVRLPYIVITCARIDSIKRVCSERPCCPGAFLDLLSIHDKKVFKRKNFDVK